MGVTLVQVSTSTVALAKQLDQHFIIMTLCGELHAHSDLTSALVPEGVRKGYSYRVYYEVGVASKVCALHTC